MSFGLPIGYQGVPSTAGTGNGFGTPAPVSIGPAAGQYGGVSSSIPAPVYQNTVGPRSNVRYQVQPQVSLGLTLLIFNPVVALVAHTSLP